MRKNPNFSGHGHSRKAVKIQSLQQQSNNLNQERHEISKGQHGPLPSRNGKPIKHVMRDGEGIQTPRY